MRRKKLQQSDCITDSKTMLLFLCEGALFCSSSLISTISKNLKNIYCFSIFLFPFYILILLLFISITLVCFTPQTYKSQVFLQIIFTCAWRLSPTKNQNLYSFIWDMHHIWSQCTQQPQALSSSQKTWLTALWWVA